MTGNITNIIDSEFEQAVFSSSIPVLVDFWAPWCGPCKSLGPVIEELSEEYATKIKFVKVDVNDNTEFANKYNVRGIPNLILFKDKEMLDQIVGAVPKETIKEMLDKYI